ncbi:MAG: hypothetical protein JWM76_3278 [Pseudonocardiales bacterium]|nr:hypothetical protein [Pseudonocardiales bacterium]
MIEEREYGTCIECGSAVVRIYRDEARTTIHSDPESELALTCILNPAALPGLRVGRA